MSSVESGSGQDFDLNIAPIIDCFTVLITYLLVSASFLSLCVLEVGVAVSGDMAPPAVQPEKPPEPPLNLLIFMKQIGTFELKVTGGIQNLNWSIPVANEKDLDARLSDLMKRLPTLKEANLSAEPTIHYKEMIKVIENVKKIIPKIFITGS